MLASHWDHELAAKVALSVRKASGGVAPTVVRAIIRETIHRLVESDALDTIETLSLHCRMHIGMKDNTFEWAADLMRIARAPCQRCVPGNVRRAT